MRRVAVMATAGCLATVAAGCGLIGSGANGQVSYQGYGGTAIVSTDGRTLTVGPYGLSCGATVTVVAHESSSRVALFVQYLTPDNPPACPPHAGTSALRLEQSIRLRVPLGRRRLVDGATGRATAWMSARLVLRPTALPPGYRLRELRPWLNLTQSSRPSCVQFYQAQNDGNELEIVQSAGSMQILGAGSGTWTQIRVRGYPGHARRNLITWRENGLTDYVLTGDQSSAGAPALSTRQLIAIADSAPAPSTAQAWPSLCTTTPARWVAISQATKPITARVSNGP